jgi:alpha-2-macroglobulin
MFIDRLFSSRFAMAGFLCFAFAGVAIATQQPVGGITGQVSVETLKSLHTIQLKGKKVYAMVSGPRSGPMIERGTWVKEDGQFQISQLPKGEYSLRVTSPGYETYHAGAFYVDEGKATAVKDLISLNTLEPSINVASKSRVFTSKEQPHFWVNVYGGNQIRFQIFSRSLLNDLKADSLRQSGQDYDTGPLDLDSSLSYYRPSEKQMKREFGKAKPVWETTRNVEMDYENWARGDFKLSKPLPKGDYVAVVDTETSDHKKTWSLFSFNVTDIGLIVKQAPERTLVKAVYLDTLKPAAGVNVQMLDLSNGATPSLTLRTNGEGLANAPLKPEDRNQTSLNWMAYGALGEDKAYSGLNYYKSETDQYETYFYTERPVYRLGQTVYFKGITRKRENSPDTSQPTFTNPGANLPVTVLVEDPDNNKLAELKLHTNQFGTFNGTTEIPKEGKTGAYMVTMTFPDGSTHSENFEVLQYRKPEYQVEVVPTGKTYFMGDRVQARIRATYYFGAPVANARVKYSVYASDDWSGRYALLSRPESERFFDNWEEHDSVDSGGGQYITEGYAQTDANGEALVEFGTTIPGGDLTGPGSLTPYDKKFKVQAEVTDLSRMSVIGSNGIPVKQSEHVVFLEPKSWVVKTGEPLEATAKVIDYDGKPVANQTLNVSLRRWHYNPNSYDYKPEILPEKQTLTTNAEGKASISLTPGNQLSTDNYDILVEGQDSKGRRLADATSIWIANGNNPYLLSENEAEKQGFQIKLDKKVYKAGDVAKVMISGPFTGKEGAEALITIEANKLYHHQTIALDGSAKLVELPILESYQPNVYVSVAVAGPKKQFYTASEMIKVSPVEHFVNVVVTTDKDTYHPGDTVNYTLQATDQNSKPVANAEVSLGIVDESIYAIRPEAAQDIRRYFYQERYNEVYTAHTFAEQYSAGPDKIEPRVRKDFRDVAAWFPTLVTNGQGIAKTSLKLPDNLTTWRATARLVSMGTDVGAGIDKMIATQDLFVRLALPRFYTEGDKGTLSAVVHNYTDKPQRVKVDLTLPEAIENQGKALQQSLTVEPDGMKRLDWSILAKTPAKQALFKVKALGETAGDALELNRDILPMGIQVSQVVSGQMTEDPETKTLDLALPKGAKAETSKSKLFLSGSLLASQLGQFDKLVDYPYGCTEQTMSRLYPTLIAARLNQALGIPFSKENQTKWHEVVKQAMNKLSEHQHGSGMWGWWVNDEDDLFLTSYVLDGYGLLKEAGQVLPEDQINQAIPATRAYQTKLFQTLIDPKTVQKSDYDKYVIWGHWTTLAYSEYALSLHPSKLSNTEKKAHEQLLATLKNKAPQLSTVALAYLKLAADSTQYKELSAISEALLMKRLKQEGEFTLWPESTKLEEADYRFNQTEVNALAFRAMLSGASSQKLSEVQLHGLQNWMLSQQDESAWFNTKATAQLLRTLMAEEIQSKGKTGEPAFTVMAKASPEASEAFASQSIQGHDAYRTQWIWDLPLMKMVQPQAFLEKSGPGRLFYTHVLKYWLPQANSENARIANRPSGVVVERQLFRLVPKAVTSNGVVHFKSDPISNWQVKAGETVMMKVKVRTPVRVPFAILEIPLPSGAEVVSEKDTNIDSVEDESGQTESIFEGDWGTSWWGHQDILDDKVAYFSHELTPNQDHVFFLTLRMEMPGEFGLNPVMLKAMYADRIQAFSQRDTVKVLQ